MKRLDMTDMNSLNGIASMLNLMGCYGQAEVLHSIQHKCTVMLEEHARAKMKTVSVTNPRNVLVQIPSLIAGIEWGLKQGDQLEVLYSDETKEVTIRPAVLGRGDFVNKS